MKRNTLTTAVLAGLTGIAGMASVANAVNVNPDGLGQVLLFPYYTARGGNDTLISIINTTDRGKAVKVRFIEAMNSREVLDFNLYMSPFDVWTAAVVATDAGGGKMVTTDTSCTVPYFTGRGNGVGEQEFLNFEYTGPVAPGSNFDAGPQGIERTASGYIEIIEMATMLPQDGYFPLSGGGINTGNPAVVEWASKHVDGVPRSCATLERFWTSNVSANRWLQSADDGFGANFGFDTERGATGGLAGAASIINVQEGTMFSYNATAVDGFWLTGTGSHTNPGSIFPNLNNGTNTEAYTFVGAPNFLETTNWGLGVLALNATLTLDKLLNEYVTDADFGGRSEWVLTFPTKRFHADALGKGLPPVTAGNPIPPFTRTWHYSVTAAGAIRRSFGCEDISIEFWDREEQTTEIQAGPPIVSPPPPTPAPDLFQLCREANVVRFSSNGSVPDSTEILGEPLREAPFGALSYTNFELPFTSGWARFNLGTVPGSSPIAAAGTTTRLSPVSDEGRQARGLPVIGFAVTTYTNAELEGGVLSNYGGTFTHRGTRAFVDSVVPQ